MDRLVDLKKKYTEICELANPTTNPSQSLAIQQGRRVMPGGGHSNPIRNVAGGTGRPTREDIDRYIEGFVKDTAKGAIVGGLVGSVVPVVGTAMGAKIGATAGATRNLLRKEKNESTAEELVWADLMAEEDSPHYHYPQISPHYQAYSGGGGIHPKKKKSLMKKVAIGAGMLAAAGAGAALHKHHGAIKTKAQDIHTKAMGNKHYSKALEYIKSHGPFGAASKIAHGHTGRPRPTKKDILTQNPQQAAKAAAEHTAHGIAGAAKHGQTFGANKPVQRPKAASTRVKSARAAAARGKGAAAPKKAKKARASKKAQE